MSVLEPTPRTTRILRVAMLAVIALVALANAAGWVDADLWIPFVCIIAVMGVGTRGGPVDALGFVLIEASVVALLGVATFSGSRDGVWAASVAVSVLAIGKIALVEMHRRDVAGDAHEERERTRKPSPASTTLSTKAIDPEPVLETGVREAAVRDEAVRNEAVGGEAVGEEAVRAPAREAAVIPRTISELPPPPISPAPLRAPKVPAIESPTPAPKKKRDRNDPTPRAVRLDRPR